MKKSTTNLFLAVIACSILLSSCMSTVHTVGTGGRADCKGGRYDAKDKQWYIFWGLLPLNKVDSKDLAGDSKNYTVMVTTSVADGLISIVGGPFLGIRTQTIRVSKGDK